MCLITVPWRATITTGPDGNLWFTELYRRIGRITPAGVITEFALPQPPPTFGVNLPGTIVAGPDGQLWFTDTAGSEIWRISTSGAISAGAPKTAYSAPCGIAAGPDSHIWFTELYGNKIGRIT